jgi:hypothetical protein
MATTKIWPVRGWLGHVVIYVENPEKVMRPARYKKDGIAEADAQGLADVIEYAMAKNKTVADEESAAIQCFVTGLNCTPTDARHQMMRTKTCFGKVDGVVALHGYQSFAPGEVAPDTAHEIGVRLARGLWGDGYQVIVATHLDKDHIHNHFVINSVSFVAGEKLRSTKGLYRDMRNASDSLCREYGLSVIEHPRDKGKHYAEWKAAAEGKPTWTDLIRTDVDEAIEHAMTTGQFFGNLKALGYEVKRGQDISVRPPGKERYFRLTRRLGGDYCIEGIQRRILEHRRVRLALPRRQGSQRLPATPPAPKGSVLALHRHYLYLFGFYRRQGSGQRMHFLLREELRRLDEIVADERLLSKRRIKTTEELSCCKEALEAQIQALVSKREGRRKAIRKDRGAGAITKDDPLIKELNGLTGKLRKEVRQMERIEKRSKTLSARIERIHHDEQEDDRRKEVRDGRDRAGARHRDEDNPARN